MICPRTKRYRSLLTYLTVKCTHHSDIYVLPNSYLGEWIEEDCETILVVKSHKLTYKSNNILFPYYLNAVNDAMSRRAVHKAIFESAALIGASALQVYLLQRLFERKLGTSRV